MLHCTHIQLLSLLNVTASLKPVISVLLSCPIFKLPFDTSAATALDIFPCHDQKGQTAYGLQWHTIESIMESQCNWYMFRETSTLF